MRDSDVRSLLDRGAAQLPPPPDTDLDRILAAGTRRRTFRIAVGTLAGVFVLALAGVIAWPVVEPTIEPLIRSEPAPFGPAIATVHVCEPGGDKECHGPSPETMERVRAVIDQSPVADIVEVITTEERLERLREYRSEHPGEQEALGEDTVRRFAESVIIEIRQTNNLVSFARDLHNLPEVYDISLGTVDRAPTDVLDQILGRFDGSPAVETDLGALQVPVAGRGDTVKYRLWQTPEGRRCYSDPVGGRGCAVIGLRPGLGSTGAGPWPMEDGKLACAEFEAGYDVEDVIVILDDNTQIESALRPLRDDLPFIKFGGACWAQPAKTVTLIAVDKNGDEIDRRQHG